MPLDPQTGFLPLILFRQQGPVFIVIYEEPPTFDYPDSATSVLLAPRIFVWRLKPFQRFLASFEGNFGPIRQSRHGALNNAVLIRERQHGDPENARLVILTPDG